jgi:P pilus assembly chaperone PapD
MKNLKILTIRARLFILISLSITSVIIPFASQAVHLSTFRIYLDEDNRNNSFILFNRDTQTEECKLFLGHNNFDDNGAMTEHQGSKPPENSAKDWVRFSPRKFTLTSAHSQTVRFTMRRKANVEPAEYRSYLNVDCGVVQPEEQGKAVNITPRLVHSVPVIVRVGKLNAEISFSDFELTGHDLSFKLLRSGTRSIYGSITLFNKETDKSVSSQSGLSIYPESSNTEFLLRTKGIPVENLVIKFSENTKYGGDKVIEQEVILTK